MSNENTAPAGEWVDAEFIKIATGLGIKTRTGIGAITLSRAVITADQALRASPAVGDAEPVAILSAADVAEIEDALSSTGRHNRLAYSLKSRLGKPSAQAALAAKDADYALGVRMLCSEIAALTAERDALRKDALRAATVAFGLMAEYHPKELPEDAEELAEWLDVYAFPLLPDDMGPEGLFIHIIRAAMNKDTK